MEGRTSSASDMRVSKVPLPHSPPLPDTLNSDASSQISSLRGGLLAVLLEERLSETGLCSGFRVAPGSEEVMRSPRVGQLAPDSEAVAPDDTGGLLR